MRRVIIHAGAGKTGTTALQVFFEANRDWLSEHGIHYPSGPDGHGPIRIPSGNGQWLLNYLTDGTDWEAVAGQLRGAAPQEDVLISSELLAHAPSDRVAQFRERLTADGFGLHVVYLVRNPDEWFLSAYQQLVKRHGLRKTYPEFCVWYPCEFARTIRNYERALGREGLTVMSYEAAKSDLVGHFLREVLHIEAQAPASEQEPTNRSLTRLELEVLVAANTVLGDAGLSEPEAGALMAPVSDTLVSVFPSIAREARFREPMPPEAIERLGPDIDLVNSRLTEGQIDYSITGSSPPLTHNETGLARVTAVVLASQLLQRRQPAAEQRTAREQELAAQVHALRSSTSWRMTAPLRRASRVARRSNGPGGAAE